jgi:hypothetical protein
MFPTILSQSSGLSGLPTRQRVVPTKTRLAASSARKAGDVPAEPVKKASKKHRVKHRTVSPLQSAVVREPSALDGASRALAPESSLQTERTGSSLTVGKCKSGKHSKGDWWRREWSRVFPINESTEKGRFLDRYHALQQTSDVSLSVEQPPSWVEQLYNPVFEYGYSRKKLSKLQGRFAVPCFSYIDLAVRILEHVRCTYGDDDDFSLANGGRVLSSPDALRLFQGYIDDNGLTDMLSVVTRPDQASPTVLRKNQLSVKIPMAYRTETIVGVCHHEIGTHFFRRINESDQVWSSQRLAYGLEDALDTEEGLATLNATIASRTKLLWRAALNYYAVCMAATMDFRSLFCHLRRYVRDVDRLWSLCVRVKRGVIDTSEPQGALFSKDQVYFRGSVDLLSRRRQIDFRLLYCGKICFRDLHKVIPFVDTSTIRLPTFLQDVEAYLLELDDIAKSNFIQ